MGRSSLPAELMTPRTARPRCFLTVRCQMIHFESDYQILSFQPRKKPIPKHHSAAVVGWSAAYCLRWQTRSVVASFSSFASLLRRECGRIDCVALDMATSFGFLASEGSS